MAGTIVALFVGAMCLIGTGWAFAASIGAVLGAQHWDRHRRPDRDDIDVITCMLGVYIYAVCVAAVVGAAFLTAFALLD